MNTKVAKWGNSLAMRIPASVAADLGLTNGSALSVTVEDGALVVRPRQQTKLTLVDLLKDVTSDMLHDETDWGNPVGREVW
jgi:antitoxin MazE